MVRVLPSSAMKTSPMPTPPIPDMKGSATLRPAATATAASTAFPPACRASNPAIVACWDAEATMPRLPVAGGRVESP